MYQCPGWDASLRDDMFFYVNDPLKVNVDHNDIYVILLR